MIDLADHPISGVADDELARDGLARTLAEELTRIPTANGAVAAIVGGWGTGKTSLMNMAAEELRQTDGVAVIEFNPWLFNDVDQLAATFLGELSKQLQDARTVGAKMKSKTGEVAKRLSKYSYALSLLKVAPYGDIAGKLAQTGLGLAAGLAGEESVQTQKADVTNLLAKVDGRIVVLVDDIDRLTPEETRDLFRVVRLTASFPNVVYLLCLDREVVERNLTSTGFAGRDYLEKILTVTCEMPRAARSALDRLFFECLEQVLQRYETGSFEEDRWGEIFYEIVQPQIRHLRDVKRLAASLPFALAGVGNEVALADLLALETLRVLSPDIWRAVADRSVSLTTSTSVSFASRDPEDPKQKAAVEHVLASRQGSNLPGAVIRMLFPSVVRYMGGGTHVEPRAAKQNRRVSSPEAAAFYFERALPDGVAPSGKTTDAAAALVDGDATKMREVLQSLSADDLRDVLDRLIDWVPEASAESVQEIVPVLFEQLPALRGAQPRGLFDVESRFSVSRLALQLLESEPAAVADIAGRVVRETPTIAGAFEMETLVGHRVNAGHRLVTEDLDAHLRLQLRERITEASAETLAADQFQVRFLYHCFQPAEDNDQPVIPQLMEGSLAHAVLLDAVSPIRSHSAGQTRLIPRLQWDVLTMIFGGQDKLEEAIEPIREKFVSEAGSEALRLYDEYRGGWRPNDFGEADD